MNIPELAHYQFKDVNPAFIRVYGFTGNEGDYFFAYDTHGFCRGAYPVKYQLIRAFGDTDDIEDLQGFKVGDPILPGYYQASTGKFFKLNSNKMFLFQPLGLFKMNVTGLGEEIELNIIPELTASVLDFDYAPVIQDVYKDENVFFNLKAENVEDIEVTKSQVGKGFIKPVKRYLSESNKFVNYVYEATDDDEGILQLNAFATNIFSGEDIETELIIILENSRPDKEEPQQESTIVYDNNDITIVRRDYKSFGEYLFVEGMPLRVILKVYKGNRVFTVSGNPAINKGRIYGTKGVQKIEVLKVGNKQINEVIEL